MSGEVVLSSTITCIVISKHYVITPIRCYKFSGNSCTNSKSRFSLRCSSSNSSSGPSPPGENQNKTVLDAFFFGKALAEELNERIESTAGEFLSTISLLQAEQRKQVQDFQAYPEKSLCIRRMRCWKELKNPRRAAHEAMEVQGTPSSTDVQAVTDLQAHDTPQVQ